MPRHPSEALGKSLSVTIIAAGADLCAAGYWIPGRVRPLDRAFIRHRPTSTSTSPALVTQSLLHCLSKKHWHRSLVPHPERRTVLRSRLAPVVEPRRRDVRVAKPLLDLGDIGLMRERVGGRRGAERVHTKTR